VSRLAFAGAASFLAAPVVAAAGVLASTTMSDDAATQVAAFADHRGAMIGGAVLENLGILLFLAGIAWLTTAVAPRARGLAIAGGILGVAGSLVILFEDGLTATLPSVVSSLDSAQATTVIHHIHSSAVSGVEPLAILQPAGCLLLALAALRSGVRRWAAGLFTVGGFLDTVGFATGSKPLTAIGFAVLLAGLIPLVHTLSGREAGALPAVQPAPRSA
jgi:hypothetical protein